MGLFNRDSRGYALSLDILLALIPLTLLLGVVAADMDNIMYQMQDVIFRGSTERVAADSVNTLLQTSGDPVDWELTGNPRVPGLALYDEDTKQPIRGTLSPTKTVYLTVPMIESVTGPEYAFYLNISLANGTHRTLRSIGTYNNNSLEASTHNASDVVREERYALYSTLKVVSEAKNLIRLKGNENRTYTSPPNPFKTNDLYLNLYDYYAIAVSQGSDGHNIASAEVMVNDKSVISQNEFNNDHLTVIKYIDPVDAQLKNGSTFQDNPVVVRVNAKPGTWIDVYIVQVPKGTPSEEVNLDNAEPKKVRIQFYLWTKNG